MRSPAPALSQLKRELKSAADPHRAEASAWFFKTGKGQYGEGDVFLGITVPSQRKIARKYRDLPLAQIGELLESPIHEHRFTALEILVMQYERGDEREKQEIVEFYLANLERANSWDLIDTSAPYILGDWLLLRDRKVLYALAKSPNVWKRRAAIVSTLAFIRAGECRDTARISEILLTDTHGLIHKATGWMLREMGKTASQEELIRFLDAHGHEMPRTMLRYAIERLDPALKRKYMKR